MARKAHPKQKEPQIEDDTYANDDAEDFDDENDDSPPTIDPYDVLGLETEATAQDVKKAYRRLALKHHPDKAPEGSQEAAKKKFQEIAFAYAVLSDDRRRKRYDLTGSTAESLQEDDDFDWLTFYRGQFENLINEEVINKLSEEFKGSDEERGELLKAYNKAKGNLNAIYELVMLSDILTDDDRFRQILDEEIAKGTIESYPAYAKENDETRNKAKDAEKKRRADFDKRQAEEEKEKEKTGKTSTKSTSKAKSKKKQGPDNMAGLAALIQQRQKQRAGSFFDHLEAKYAPKPRGSKRAAPMDIDEPSEEAFQAMADRAKKQKRGERAEKNTDADIDLGEEDILDSDGDEGEEEDEKPVPNKSKARKSRPKPKARDRSTRKG